MIVERKKHCRGSLTVEATLIMPFVIISVVLLLFLSILYYQTLSMRSIVNLAAERMANSLYYGYDTQVAHFNNSSYVNEEYLMVHSKEAAMYRELLFGINDEDRNRVESTLIDTLKRNTIIGKNRCLYKVNITGGGSFIQKSFRIDVACQIVLPLSGWLRVAGIKSPYTVTASSQVSINRAKEFINNTDLISDFSKRTGLKGEVERLVQKLYQE